MMVDIISSFILIHVMPKLLALLLIDYHKHITSEPVTYLNHQLVILQKLRILVLLASAATAMFYRSS